MSAAILLALSPLIIAVALEESPEATMARCIWEKQPAAAERLLEPKSADDVNAAMGSVIALCTQGNGSMSLDKFHAALKATRPSANTKVGTH